MNEPYVKTSVVDQTSGITSVTSSNGIQIGCPINSLTGPTERVTLNTLADLVKYFMPGTSFSSSDDITIQHVGALLGSSPVDVIRVDSSTMREAIGSDGNRIYFDSDYNLIDNYTNLTISGVNQNLKPEVIYVAATLGAGSSASNVVFYAGDNSKIPSKYTNQIAVSGDSAGDDGVDIDKFFKNFQASLALAENSGLIEDNTGLISNTDTEAVFNVTIEEVGTNLFHTTLNQFGTQLNYVKLPVKTSSTEYNLVTGTNIYIDGKTLYLNTGVESTTAWPNPVAIPATPIGSGNSLPASVWYAMVVDYINSSSDIQNTTGYAATNALQVRSGTFTLSGDIKEQAVLNLTTSSKDTIIIPGTITEVSNYLIKLNAGNADYYFGDAEGLRSAPKSATKTTLHAKTLPGIYAELYQELKANSSLASSVVALPKVEDNYIYYLEDVLPSITSVLMTSDGEITAVRGFSSGTSVSHLTTLENAKAYTFDGLWVLIDGNFFYTGNVSNEPEGITTRIRMASGPVDIYKFASLLYENFSAVFSCYGNTSTGFIISGDYSASTSASDKLTVNSRLVNQSVYPDKFAVVAAFPSTSKLFKYSYSKDESKEGLYKLALQYKSDSWEYSISFDPEAVDGYGNSEYFESVINSNGDINVFFRVVELAGSTVRDSYVSPSYGNNIERVIPSDADYITALNKFGEYDNKHYNYLWDAGYASPSLAAAGVRLATDINAEFVPSFPVSYKRKDQFVAYRNSTGIDNPRAYFLAPAQKQAALGNFNSTLAGSLTFLRSRINLYNTGASEFAPSFGPNYGNVSVGTLVTTFGKSTREELLDSQINTISVGTTGATINFNLTAQKMNSYLCEEQFMYLSNIICHVADDYGDSLIGYPNDTATRMRVVNELTDRLNQRINANKNPTVTAFQVVCNDDLNPTSVVESRQIKYEVWVQYTPTVAYVLATTVIKRLGSF